MNAVRCTFGPAGTGMSTPRYFFFLSLDKPLSWVRPIVGLLVPKYQHSGELEAADGDGWHFGKVDFARSILGQGNAVQSNFERGKSLSCSPRPRAFESDVGMSGSTSGRAMIYADPESSRCCVCSLRTKGGSCTSLVGRGSKTVAEAHDVIADPVTIYHSGCLSIARRRTGVETPSRSVSGGRHGH